jgi:hypothetical protein
MARSPGAGSGSGLSYITASDRTGTAFFEAGSCRPRPQSFGGQIYGPGLRVLGPDFRLPTPAPGFRVRAMLYAGCIPNLHSFSTLAN